MKITSDSNLKDTTNGGDILFTAGDGTTKLSHEIELYSNVNGDLVAWVKVPAVSSTTNTTIYMYYGNSTVVDQEDPQNVWDVNS